MYHFTPKSKPPKPYTGPVTFIIAPLPWNEAELWHVTSRPLLAWVGIQTRTRNPADLLEDCRRECRQRGGWIYVTDAKQIPNEVYEWTLVPLEDSPSRIMTEIKHDPKEFRRALKF